jgi:hypothetical protein
MRTIINCLHLLGLLAFIITLSLGIILTVGMFNVNPLIGVLIGLSFTELLYTMALDLKEDLCERG